MGLLVMLCNITCKLYIFSSASGKLTKEINLRLLIYSSPYCVSALTFPSTSAMALFKYYKLIKVCGISILGVQIRRIETC